MFTTSGKAFPTRLDLRTGERTWIKTSQSSAIARWDDDLLVDACEPDRLFALDPETGTERWVQAVAAGMQDSFVVEDYFVGHVPGCFHVIDLAERRVVWSVTERASNPLVSDGAVVIRADDDVTCYDLGTGAVRWHRSGAEFGGNCWQMGFIWRDLFVVKIGEPLLLTAFEVKTGKTVWRTDFPVQWCEPYGERAYGIEAKGAYKALDIATGKVVFEKAVPDVPPPAGEKKGLTVQRDPDLWPWRDARVAVSESHAFVQRPSGQIVVLGRETGFVEQVVEIDGMPVGRAAPIIYENRLLLTDFNACVYCFEGAS